MEIRYLLLLLFVCNHFCTVYGRPRQLDSSDENEAEDAEYVGDDDPGDGDTANENEESGSQDKALSYAEQKEKRDENDNAENLNEDYKESEDTPKLKPMHNENDRYSKYTSNQEQREENGKRTIEYQNTIQPLVNEGDDSIFETNQDRNDAKIQTDNRKQSRYLRQFYKTMQAGNKGYIGNKKYGLHNIRDRRYIQETDDINLSCTPSQKLNVENYANEDEESAIKKHVKKLSGAELEELLKSLSEDKRALLKKIMDSETEVGMNKREIKKEGPANAESNLLESGQSDSGKSQSYDTSESTDAVTDVSVSRSSEATDKIKDEQETSTKIGDMNVSDCTDKQELIIEPKVNKSPIKDSVTLNTLNQEPDIKIENKREITSVKNEDELSNVPNIQSDSNDDGYSSDDDLSDLIEEEAKLHYDNLNAGDVFKRELHEKALPSSGSIKALSESFPNSNMYDESNLNSNSDMVPLIRVKRTNLTLRKPDTASLKSDAKVAYVPCGSENEYDNMDEGNEFENDGFHEPDLPANDKNQPINLKSDTMNLGTDTDSVLSGIEDVDENLMFSSGTRNRRTDENNIQNIASDSENIPQSARSLQFFDDEGDTVSDRNNIISNAQQYKDDVFGQLPLNHDRDLGRYKRVRHVKQKLSVEND